MLPLGGSWPHDSLRPSTPEQQECKSRAIVDGPPEPAVGLNRVIWRTEDPDLTLWTRRKEKHKSEPMRGHVATQRMNTVRPAWRWNLPTSRFRPRASAP